MTGHEAHSIASEINTDAIASGVRYFHELEELEKQIEFNRLMKPTQEAS